MLDFRIDTFLCVCKHMNYTKAADELNLTQPAVSQHIKYLEEFYGTKLFIYSKKTLSLTTEGVMLKNSMLSMRHDELFIKKQIGSSRLRPVIKFGATLSIGEFFLPQRLSKYLKENPDNRCNLTIADTSALLSSLNDGTIDFALVEGYFDKSEFDYSLIKSENFVGICGKNYDMPPVEKFEDLFNHHLLIRERGSGTREVFTNYLAEHGYRTEHFKMCSVINNLNVIKYLVSQSIGISFIYNEVVKDELKNGSLRKIEIPNFNLSHEFNFIWRKNSIFANYYKSMAEVMSDGRGKDN